MFRVTQSATLYLHLNKMVHKNRKVNQGFTLIEVLVSSAILVILAVGFLGLQYILSRNQVTAWNSYMSVEDSNVAMSTMVKELRNATNSGNGSYLFDSLQNQEIIFYTDYDFDNQVERVRYILSGSQLRKGIIEPVGDPAVYNPVTEKITVISEIIRNGSDPLFYYYNSDWPQDTINNPLSLTERIANTRVVKIYLKSSPRTDTTDFDYILESEIRIRMLQDS